MSTVVGNFTLDVGALSGAVHPIMERRARSVRRQIATQARSDTPVRTGYLGRSIVEDPIVWEGPFRLKTGVTATASYAAAVHEGTRPHVIRARPGGTLAFKVGGNTVFAQSVNHPGTRPRPFLTNAAREVINQL